MFCQRDSNCQDSQIRKFNRLRHGQDPLDKTRRHRMWNCQDCGKELSGQRRKHSLQSQSKYQTFLLPNNTPASEASRKVANFIERKNPHTPVFGVK